MIDAQLPLVVEMRDVYKTLGGKPVLQGVDLQVRRNETLVIIGRSGAGKSVSIKHIVGLLRPDRGTVIVEGQDLAQLSTESLEKIRLKFGYLFQDGALLQSMTVGENVALPLVEHTRMPEGEIRKAVHEKLALVGMDHVADVMPSVLSGGMKKRVGLARALIRNPQIILYDEPTHGLDPIMTAVVNQLILDMKNQFNVTSIVVTHDMPSAFRIADRIAMLYKGKIVKVGSPVEFLETEDPLIKQFVYGEEEGPMTS